MANQHDNVEEELLRRQQEEFEHEQQKERLAKLQEEEEQRRNSPLSQAKTAGKEYAKTAVKNYAKEEAAALATSAGEAIVASAPIWGPILGIILLVVAGGVFIFFSLVTYCNQGGLSGFAATVVSKVSMVAGSPIDFCAAIKVNNQLPTVAQRPTTTTGLDIVVTSAFREGAIVAGTTRLSAHGRGEAVDIALRPAVPIHSSDPRIAELVAIAKGVGFNPAAGDTLDEYTNPTEGASGGHVHVEFNLRSDGSTFCDGTIIPALGPVDLQPIPSTIPVQGASDPRLRPCMIIKVQQIFDAAKALPPTP